MLEQIYSETGRNQDLSNTLQQSMLAVVNRRYGDADVLQLKEVVKPQPKDREILIRIKATAVSSGDWKMRKADPCIIRLFFGLLKPKKNILGYVLSGVVESVGDAVTKFKPGEAVYATTGMDFGAYAEYKCIPENGVIALKPESLSFEQAAAIPFGGNTALYFLRQAHIRKSQKVLIYGASGAVGTAAVQLAKYFGAEVTAVCSGRNVDMVKSLGADKVIDYLKQDFSQIGEVYDVIYDTVGKSSFADCLSVLKAEGYLIMSAAGITQIIRGAWVSLTGRQKVISGVMSETAADLEFLATLIEAGDMKAVIDRSYPLAEIADAHRYVEKGHKKGNVVIRV